MLYRDCNQLNCSATSSKLDILALLRHAMAFMHTGLSISQIMIGMSSTGDGVF